MLKGRALVDTKSIAPYLDLKRVQFAVGRASEEWECKSEAASHKPCSKTETSAEIRKVAYMLR